MRVPAIGADALALAALLGGWGSSIGVGVLRLGPKRPRQLGDQLGLGRQPARPAVALQEAGAGVVAVLRKRGRKVVRLERARWLGRTHLHGAEVVQVLE